MIQLCSILWNPMDWSLPGSSVHGILQAKILKWVAIHFSRGSSRLRGQIRSPALQADFFTVWATREALTILSTPIVKLTISGFRGLRLLESTNLKVKILTVEGTQPVAPATFCPAAKGQVLWVHRSVEISDATSKVTRAGQSITKVPAHLSGSRPLWLLSATVRHDLKDEFT